VRCAFRNRASRKTWHRKAWLRTWQGHHKQNKLLCLSVRCFDPAYIFNTLYFTLTNAHIYRYTPTHYPKVTICLILSTWPGTKTNDSDLIVILSKLLKDPSFHVAEAVPLWWRRRRRSIRIFWTTLRIRCWSRAKSKPYTTKIKVLANASQKKKKQKKQSGASCSAACWSVAALHSTVLLCMVTTAWARNVTVAPENVQVKMEIL